MIKKNNQKISYFLCLKIKNKKQVLPDVFSSIFENSYHINHLFLIRRKKFNVNSHQVGLRNKMTKQKIGEKKFIQYR